MSQSDLLQHMANGLSLGALYALLAIGYTMVYGVVRLINFAHGSIFMAGAYAAFVFVTIMGIQWIPAFTLTIIVTVLLGMSVERVAYRPLRNAPRISALISAIGVAFLLENLGIVIFGGRPKSFHRPEVFNGILKFGEVSFPVLTIYIVVITAALLAGLSYLIYRTKPGAAMRAMSLDFETARLVGIDVDRIVAIPFVAGSALAAVGGILWALRYPQINPLMGAIPGLKAFIAAIFGGIGSVPGATIGGVVLGFGEIMLIAFLPLLSGYRDALAFVILVLVLLIRPTGLMGEKRQVKV